MMPSETVLSASLGSGANGGAAYVACGLRKPLAGRLGAPITFRSTMAPQTRSTGSHSSGTLISAPSSSKIANAISRGAVRSMAVRIAANLTAVRLTAVMVLVSSVFGTGCAYRAGYGARQFPGGYNTVAVPVFKNSTTETGVEVFFTNAFIRELERVRVGRITNRNDAQVVVEGSIDSIRYVVNNQIQGSDANQLPNNTILNTEYRIFAQIGMRLRRVADQKIIWEGTFENERIYSAPRVGAAGVNSVNANYNLSARYQNLQVMAADLMAEAHDRITENF